MVPMVIRRVLRFIAFTTITNAEKDMSLAVEGDTAAEMLASSRLRNR